MPDSYRSHSGSGQDSRVKSRNQAQS
ncbi:MAG: hypothetical protein JWQ62_1387, partial [Lacunisphaera sp.]|nr:hypothetical protein [Lacunisphaera sp.]